MFKFFKEKKDVVPFVERKAITLKDFSNFGIPKGAIVTVMGCDSMRGYSFKDDAGHSNIGTTMNYTHSYIEGKKDIADRIDEIYRPLFQIKIG